MGEAVCTHVLGFAKPNGVSMVGIGGLAKATGRNGWVCAMFSLLSTNETWVPAFMLAFLQASDDARNFQVCLSLELSQPYTLISGFEKLKLHKYRFRWGRFHNTWAAEGFT